MSLNEGKTLLEGVIYIDTLDSGDAYASKNEPELVKKLLDHSSLYLFTNCLTRGAKSGGTWDPKCLHKYWLC